MQVLLCNRLHSLTGLEFRDVSVGEKCASTEFLRFVLREREFNFANNISSVQCGGPILDSKGILIGINTAIFTQTGTSAGVRFAIASSTVSKIVPQLIQFGKVPGNSPALPVRNKTELSKILDDYNVGDKVLLKIQRGSKNLDLSLVLEEKKVPLRRKT